MTHAITTEAQLEEARRLTVEIEELQARLDFLLASDDEPEEGIWDAWPYSWAVAGWNTARARFHSFHQKREAVATPSFEPARELRLV